MSDSRTILLLGVGQVGQAIKDLVRDKHAVTGTTRNPLRIFQLLDSGISPIIMPLPFQEVIEPLARGSDVVVSFPPDGSTDAILAPGCRDARRLIYISTTGVYGSREGIIDDTTEIEGNPDDVLKKRLDAEHTWRSAGGIVLRVPGIYGRHSGLHLSLRQGRYRLPDGGQRMASRIHVEDLAGVIAAMLEAPSLSHDTYVIGDSTPCSQLEIVSWLCEQMQLPLPASVPLDEAPRTLRGNRRVDGKRLLDELGYQLKYPDYKSGYLAILFDNQPEP